MISSQESSLSSFCRPSLVAHNSLQGPSLRIIPIMKSIWITALTFAAGVLAGPLVAAGPQLQSPQLQAEKGQFLNGSTVLSDLLHQIQSQTGAIGQYPP